MRKNKKGLMLNFLLGLVLALIIFLVPSCILANMLRLTGEAKENFIKFVGEAKELAEEGFEGEMRNHILNLDKETAVVFFEPGFSEVKAVGGGETYMFNRPSQCKGEKNCLCLFREVKERNNILEGGKKLCYVLEFKVRMGDCTPVLGEELVACSQGFFIGREIGELEGLRRVNVQMTKAGEEIVLERK